MVASSLERISIKCPNKEFRKQINYNIIVMINQFRARRKYSLMTESAGNARD